MNALTQTVLKTTIVEEPQDFFVRELRAHLAALTGGLSPEQFVRAWWMWYLHLAQSPKIQAELARYAVHKMVDTWQFAVLASTVSRKPVESDRRFAHTAWSAWPFSMYARAYKNWEEWWHRAATSVPSVDARSAQLLHFSIREWTQIASPSHYLLANPELLSLTHAEAGRNLIRGYKHWLDDLKRTLRGLPPAAVEHIHVGRDVAITPGKVVLRNELAELIQYSPQTTRVHAEPILITPAWIMKYYILDLSPINSMVRYLVDKGHTVFIISWKNPTAVDRHLGMDDYLELGFFAAMDAVTAIVPNRKIHVVGYCIGGTLSLIGAAALAQQGDQRIRSLTLLAALADFSKPGELSLFIEPNQLTLLDAMMWKRGVLEGRQMAAAFQMLRSYDLVWHPLVKSYFHGVREQATDLMAWNADVTRMPWRMHSEYLKRLYLHNELVRDSFEVHGTPISLRDIKVPMFVVGTETDHVAPWRAVYKVRQYTESDDYTFLLTSGGHNAGIVSGPSNPKRRYRGGTWNESKSYVPPDEWFASARIEQGSWWPVWQRWLHRHSDGRLVPPPSVGKASHGYCPTTDAPGEYVLQR